VIRTLDPVADERAIQALFEQDPGFFVLTEGAPPRPTEARDTFADGPPGVRKLMFAIERDRELAGVLDVLDGYPDAQTWYLGLIFIAPHARGTGTGRAAIDWLSERAAAAGATRLRLAVTVGNPRARALYDRLGFTFVDRRTRTSWCGAVIECDVLDRSLTSGAGTTG
jgi:ribosomal protein S18 acetylase RimI-like enzyme